MATASEAPIYDPGLLAEQLGAATPDNPVATQADLANLAGGAPQWVAGAQKEGALVYNAGYVYRVAQDIANGQAAPTATNAFYLKLPVYNDPRLAGLTDADSAAPRSVTTALTTRLDFIRRSVIRYYDPIARLTNDLADTALKYESGGSYVLTKGSYDALMELSPVVTQQARQGDIIGVQVTPGTPDFTLKPTPLQAFGSSDGPKTFTAIAGWQYEFHAVLPSGNGTQNSYWVVHSTPSTGTGTPGTARDPFAVGDNPTITNAVLDLSNTWVKGDLTAFGSDALRNAGAPPAVSGQNSTILVGTADVATMDEFDKTDANGYSWRFRYSRRNDGTSGWTRLGKTA